MFLILELVRGVIAIVFVYPLLTDTHTHTRTHEHNHKMDLRLIHNIESPFRCLFAFNCNFFLSLSHSSPCCVFNASILESKIWCSFQATICCCCSRCFVRECDCTTKREKKKTLKIECKWIEMKRSTRVDNIQNLYTRKYNYSSWSLHTKSWRGNDGAHGGPKRGKSAISLFAPRLHGSVALWRYKNVTKTKCGRRAIREF